MLISLEVLLYQGKLMFRLYCYVALIIITTSCSDLISNYPDLGQGYRFVHEGKYGLSIVNKKNTIIIQQHVIDYEYDSIFVLVAHRPVNSILGRDTMTYSEFNQAFRSSSFKQYWIIDKTKPCNNIGFDSINQFAKYSNVYGPYSKNEFTLKRNFLGVSEKLQLE